MKIKKEDVKPGRELQYLSGNEWVDAVVYSVTHFRTGDVCCEVEYGSGRHVAITSVAFDKFLRERPQPADYAVGNLVEFNPGSQGWCPAKIIDMYVTKDGERLYTVVLPHCVMYARGDQLRRFPDLPPHIPIHTRCGLFWLDKWLYWAEVKAARLEGDHYSYDVLYGVTTYTVTGDRLRPEGTEKCKADAQERDALVKNLNDVTDREQALRRELNAAKASWARAVSPLNDLAEKLK